MKIGKHSDPNGGCVVMLGGMVLTGAVITVLVWEVIPWLM